MFARVPGPFFVVIAASGMVRASDMRVVSEFGANSLRPRSQAAFNFRSVASRIRSAIAIASNEPFSKAHVFARTCA
jgi:hypothetical protein